MFGIKSLKDQVEGIVWVLKTIGLAEEGYRDRIRLTSEGHDFCSLQKRVADQNETIKLLMNYLGVEQTAPETVPTTIRKIKKG